MAELQHEADPSTELERVDAAITAAKELHQAEQIARQENFRKAALLEHRRQIIKLGRPASHPRAFVVDQPEQLLIGRKHVPLGESDPSLLRMGWHRDDYRLPAGQADFKKAKEGKGFGPVRSTGRLRLGGVGDHVREGGAAPPAAITRGSLPTEGAARHPRAWQSADAVGREFHRYDYFRPPTAHEAKMAALLTQPDRTRYRPEDEGMPAWRATDGQLQRGFSRVPRDDEVLGLMEERKERETFSKLGIELPRSVHQRAAEEAQRRRPVPAPHAALLRRGRAAMGIPRAALVAAQRTGANLLSDPRLGGRRAVAAAAGAAQGRGSRGPLEGHSSTPSRPAGSRQSAAASAKVTELVGDALSRTRAFQEARAASRSLALSRSRRLGSGSGSGSRAGAGVGLPPIRDPTGQVLGATGRHGLQRGPGRGAEKSKTMRPGFGGLA